MAGLWPGHAVSMGCATQAALLHACLSQIAACGYRSPSPRRAKRALPTPTLSTHTTLKMHTHKHTHTCAHARTHTNTHTHAHTHTYTHTCFAATWFWITYEALLCGLMLAGLLVLVGAAPAPSMGPALCCSSCCRVGVRARLAQHAQALRARGCVSANAACARAQHVQGNANPRCPYLDVHGPFAGGGPTSAAVHTTRTVLTPSCSVPPSLHPDLLLQLQPRADAVPVLPQVWREVGCIRDNPFFLWRNRSVLQKAMGAWGSHAGRSVCGFTQCRPCTLPGCTAPPSAFTLHTLHLLQQP